jgi:polyhydroxyalkanoate synthase
MSFLPLLLTNAYLHGIAIANTYNLIYLRAFERAIAEQQREYIIEPQKMGNKSDKETATKNVLETFYNRWLRNADEELRRELKSDHFVELLSKYTQELLDLRLAFRKAGYPVDYMDRLLGLYKRMQSAFSFQIAKESNLAPFNVAYRKGKSRLLHYRYNEEAEINNIGKTATSGTKKNKEQRRQPLLIIYAPINTFHILDLNSKKSVVRNLLSSGGLDIYLLDWGYPDSSDDHLSIEDYLSYIDDSVKVIKEQTGADKVSLMGYCWGGIFALMYSALNNNNVRNLILMAVPVDFSKDDTILTKWSKAVDTNRMMDELGRMDGQMLDLAFLMRNPPRYAFDKYMKFFQKMHDKEFVRTFIDVERWLYDTPPIPGTLHRQIIRDCYKNNMLVSHRMPLSGNGATAQEASNQQSTIVAEAIDLSKITMPVLTIIAEKDDLVSPASSLAINDHISSKDKSVFKNPGGHVALCISDAAHKKLWPDVVKWLLSR